MRGARAEGVGRAGTQGALGHVGGTGVAVGAGQRERAAALLGDEAAAADGTAERFAERARIDDGVVAAGQLDGIGDGQAVRAEAERGAVVHRQRAGAQRLAVAEVEAALLQRGATGVGVGARQRQRAGADLHERAAGAAVLAAIGDHAADRRVRAQRPHADGLGAQKQAPGARQRTDREPAGVVRRVDTASGAVVDGGAFGTAGVHEIGDAAAAIDDVRGARAAAVVEARLPAAVVDVGVAGRGVLDEEGGARGVQDRRLLRRCSLAEVCESVVIVGDACRACAAVAIEVGAAAVVVDDAGRACGAGAVESGVAVLVGDGQRSRIHAGLERERRVDDDGSAAQGSAGCCDQRPVVDKGAATVAVGRAEHQRAGAGLLQAAAAGKHAVECQRLRRINLESRTARAHRDIARAGGRAGGAQGAAVERERAGRAAEGGVVGNGERAAQHVPGRQFGGGAGQRPGAGARLLVAVEAAVGGGAERGGSIGQRAGQAQHIADAVRSQRPGDHRAALQFERVVVAGDAHCIATRSAVAGEAPGQDAGVDDGVRVAADAQARTADAVGSAASAGTARTSHQRAGIEHRVAAGLQRQAGTAFAAAAHQAADGDGAATSAISARGRAGVVDNGASALQHDAIAAAAAAAGPLADASVAPIAARDRQARIVDHCIRGDGLKARAATAAAAGQAPNATVAAVATQESGPTYHGDGCVGGVHGGTPTAATAGAIDRVGVGNAVGSRRPSGGARGTGGAYRAARTASPRRTVAASTPGSGCRRLSVAGGVLADAAAPGAGAISRAAAAAGASGHHGCAAAGGLRGGRSRQAHKRQQAHGRRGGRRSSSPAPP